MKLLRSGPIAYNKHTRF